LADTREGKLKGNTGTITKRCISFMKFSSSAGHKNLILNTELTKIEITVVINLKWHNLDYPSCYLVGRPHLTFPVTNKLYT
jgi:hypothetical protein